MGQHVEFDADSRETVDGVGPIRLCHAEEAFNERAALPLELDCAHAPACLECCHYWLALWERLRCGA